MVNYLKYLLLILFSSFSFATTIHVAITGSDDSGDGTVANPYANIQHGIDAASDGDTILVAPAVYYENINFNGNIIVGSLFLTTGDDSYIASTIIDGSSVGSVVKFENEENHRASLQGSPYRMDTRTMLEVGYIVLIPAQTISHSVITSNIVDWYGGGVYCERSNPHYV